MNLFFWIALTLLCIAIQSFYSMQEMAMVSFNKVRLQFYVNKGNRRARWIQSLLQRPSILFGTTLLGVNLTLQVGSQCSREVYIALNLNPDIAPLTQVFLVLVFAELSPLFAARRYSEQVAMLGIPIIYISSLIMRPIIWIIGIISGIANRIVGGKKGQALSRLSREELAHLVGGESPQEDDFNLLVENIFALRSKQARHVMTPMHSVQSLPAESTVSQVRTLLRRHDVPCLPLYYRSQKNIILIAIPRDLVAIALDQSVRDVARSPWFITQETPLMEILSQFRTNNQNVAVILDRGGNAVGLITLEDILEEIFGEERSLFGRKTEEERQFVERTLPASTLVGEFNQLFDAKLRNEEESLAQLVVRLLGHPPKKGDLVHIRGFELKVTSTTLMGAKTVRIRTTNR